MDVNEIWQNALSYLEKDINAAVSPVTIASFNAYIKPAKPVSYSDNTLKDTTFLYS